MHRSNLSKIGLRYEVRIEAAGSPNPDCSQNAGDGFFNTLDHLQRGISRYVGGNFSLPPMLDLHLIRNVVADMLALGAKTAIEQW